MRPTGRITTAVLGAALLLGSVTAPAVSDPAHTKRVLVFSKTAGFRHDSIPEGVEAVRQLGRANGFTVDTTEDAGAFTGRNLSRYDAVVFMSTTGDVLDAAQQDAFEGYIPARRRLRGRPRGRRHRVRLGLLRRPRGRLVPEPPGDPAGDGERGGPRPPGDLASGTDLGAYGRVCTTTARTRANAPTSSPPWTRRRTPAAP
ncbi:hypothetical protein GCM10017687_87880 [Streptomyces echinatus]